MALLLDADFAADVEGFSAGSQVEAEGVDLLDGYLSVPANTTATKSFTAVSSGVVRFSVSVRYSDTTTAADATRNVAIHLLPTAGSVAASNAAATLTVSNDTGDGATSLATALMYGSTLTAIDGLSPYIRGGWLTLTFVLDFSTNKYDIYLGDDANKDKRLWLRKLDWDNAAASDLSRVAVVSGTNAAAIHLDEIQVESAYTDPAEAVVVDHTFVGGSGEIEDSTPSTDTQQANPQPWSIALDTATIGAYTLGANGAQPDNEDNVLALQECGVDGEFEVEWRTSASSSSNIYCGLFFRVWGGADGDGYFGLRYWGGSGSKWILFQGSTTVASSNAVTLATDTTISLRVVVRGRYIWVYQKSSDLDSGSYSLILGPHLVQSSATGARGVLSEALAGPFYAAGLASVTDNYCRRFRYTGVGSKPLDSTFTVGDNTYRIDKGSCPGWYSSDVSATTRNLGWSKGLFQAGHRSRADMANGDCRGSTEFDATNVKSYRRRGSNVAEDGSHGWSDVWSTFLRRGVWVSDETTILGTTENIFPDMDLRADLWDLNYRVCSSSGTGTALSSTTFHSFRNDLTGEALPLGFQRLTSAASGNKVRLTQIGVNDSGWSGSSQNLQTQTKGTGGPISQGMRRTSLVSGNTYRIARAYLLETGALSLDDATLTGFRDDVASPASFTFATGAAKTDADGDTNADGFNERHGWYEITSASSEAEITNDAQTRYKPCFRIHGLASDMVTLTLGGVSKTQGSDFWVDDLGDGSHVLQMNDNMAGSETLSLSASIPLSVTASADPATVTGTTTDLTATPTGGTAPYTHAWSATVSPAGSSPSFDDATSATPTVTFDLAGSYTFSVTVTDDDGTEATDTADVTVDGSYTFADRLLLSDLHGLLNTAGDSPKFTSAVTAEIASDVRTNLVTELGRIDATISSRSSHSAADVAAEVSVGSGEFARTIRVEDASNNAIQGARVTVVGTTLKQTTPTGGEVTFNLDSGSRTFRVSAPPGYADPSDTTITVSANGSTTITVTATGSLTPPDNPLLSTVSARCVDEEGANEEGVSVQARIIEVPSGDTGVSYDGVKQTATSDANGVAQLTLVRLGVYEVWRGTSKQRMRVTVADAGTQELPSFIGADA